MTDAAEALDTAESTPPASALEVPEGPSGDVALLRNAAAALSELSARLQAAEQRAAALERDRDWWKAHCEEVVRDWKADCEELARHKERVEGNDGGTDALRALLRYFDPLTQSVRLRDDSGFLVDAFARAADSLSRTQDVS